MFDAREIKEIRQKGMAMLRGNAFRVKLDAVQGIGFVLKTHDDAIAGFSRYLEAIGKCLAFNGQGVIARRLELGRQTGEDTGARIAL